jgi:hypothetical protein
LLNVARMSALPCMSLTVFFLTRFLVAAIIFGI